MGRKALARIRVRFVAIAAGVLLGVLSLGCASSTPPDAETIAASAGTAGEGAVAASPAIVE